MATGTFYRIDQFGDGTVTIYRLANGSYALRLENFYVTPNTDLEVQLNSLEAPHSTDEVAHAARRAGAGDAEHDQALGDGGQVDAEQQILRPDHEYIMEQINTVGIL